MQLLGDVLNTRGSAALSHVIGKALRVERIIGQPLKLFLLHSLAVPAVHTAHIELEVHPRIPAAQIPYPPPLAVVPPRLRARARTTGRFFERRVRRTTRARRSPNRPGAVRLGVNPGNR